MIDLFSYSEERLYCLSGSFTFEEWGVASGNIDVKVSVPVGEFVDCRLVEDMDICYFSAIVTKVEYDHSRHVYSMELKDPVSAILDGEVEFSAGTAAEVLEEIITSAGTYFNNSYASPTTPIFGTYEDPVQWVDLVKTISLAEGIYVAYSPTFGEYILNKDGAYQNEYGPGSIVPISPLSASTTLDMDRYGNSAVVTVDADWTEEETETHDEIEYGVGVTRTVTKIGERPISAVTAYDDGSGLTEAWTWNEDGKLAEYETVSRSTENYVTVEEITDLQVWDESENGIEHTQTVTVRQNYDPYSQWVNVPDTLQNVRKTVTVTKCGVEENSLIQVYEEIYTYNPDPDPGDSVWELWEKGYKTGVPDAAGLVGSSISKYYRYIIDPVEGEWWAINRTERGGALSRPTTNNIILAVNKIGKHFSATANDDDSIAAIGERVQEFEAFGLTTIEDVEAAASNFLTYCERANTATVTVKMQPFCVGDKVSWNGYTWTVEQVSLDLGSYTTSLKITRSAGIVDVTDKALADNNNLGRAVIAAIEKKGKRLNNAARAQVIAQVDYETYVVHIQGEPAEKTRIARADYQKGVTYRPGKEVMLIRPTGKNTRWEIVSKRNEEPTVITTVGAGGDPYVPITTSISLGRSVYLPDDTLLLRVSNLNLAEKVQVSWGDEGEEVIRTYSRTGGSSWTPAATNKQYTDYGDTLESGYNYLYLIRPILAPLDPTSNPTQSCSGKLRLQGSGGEWTNWHEFNYTFKAPQVTKCEYTLGTPYTGGTAADAPSAPVVDATFKACVDFSPLLPSEWQIQYGYLNDQGKFATSSVFQPYFRLYAGSIPLPVTGVFVWRFSSDGEDWHSDPQTGDLFVQVGNGTAWGDVKQVAHGKSTSYGTFGEIVLTDGQGTRRLYDWYALDKDENGDAEIGPITYRLGYSGPGQYFQAPAGSYTFGPPYPGIESEFNPYVVTDITYTWQERGEVV